MDLNELEALAKAATPGPWFGFYDGVRIADDIFGRANMSIYVASVMCTTGENGQESRNAAYIAAANPKTMQEMIALIRSHEAEIDGLKVRADMLAAELLAAQQAKPAGQAGAEDPMPKRTAFLAWCKEKSLDTSVDIDAWGTHIYKHSHIQAMWEGWFSAPAVIAASQPVAPVQRHTMTRELRAALAQSTAIGEAIVEITRERDAARAQLARPADLAGLKRYSVIGTHNLKEECVNLAVAESTNGQFLTFGDVQALLAGKP